MNQRITVISHFTREEVLAALRALHPWIPEEAKITMHGMKLIQLEIEYTKQNDLAVSREE